MHRVGFEPTKHDAIELESIPFDQLGNLCQHKKKCLTTSWGLEPLPPDVKVWRSTPTELIQL